MLAVANTQDGSTFELNSVIFSPKISASSTLPATPASAWHNIRLQGVGTTSVVVAAVSCSSLGCSAGFASASTGLPSAPSSLDVRVANEDMLSLSIGTSAYDGGANVTHYNVSAMRWQWAADGESCDAACLPAACSIDKLNDARAVTTDPFTEFFGKMVPSTLTTSARAFRLAATC